VEGLQIVDALKTIDDGKPRIMALHYLSARHPASAVKLAALAAIHDVPTVPNTEPQSNPSS